MAVDIPPYSRSSGLPSSPARNESTARRSARSSSPNPWSSATLNTSVSTLVWVSLSSSTLASKRGPNELTAARSGTPCWPVRLTNSTGAARGSHADCTAASLESIAGVRTPGAAIPERSPFTSAAKTGTPWAESCSARSCSVLVFPVPVAPAIRP